MGQEVSSPLFCLDAGKQDSPQKSSLYAKKVAPKNLKVLPFNVKEKGNEGKTYIQVALELTLVKEFVLFLKVHIPCC